MRQDTFTELGANFLLLQRDLVHQGLELCIPALLHGSQGNTYLGLRTEQSRTEQMTASDTYVF